MNAIDQYIQLADEWGVSIEDGDSDAANLLHDRIQEVFRTLCHMKQEDALFDRADTANDAACFFIASHLKDRDQPRAIALYERLSRSSQPFVAMSAKHIVNEMTAHGR